MPSKRRTFRDLFPERSYLPFPDAGDLWEYVPRCTERLMEHGRVVGFFQDDPIVTGACAPYHMVLGTPPCDPMARCSIRKVLDPF